MHHSTNRIGHTTAFVTPVVKHWLECEIVQWVHPMKDRSDDPSHHERTLLPRSYISLPKSQMHKLAVKQPHESLLILLRYRMNGHNARIFYCMGETSIVYITVVILLTPRKTGGCGGHTPNENELYVKIAMRSNPNYYLKKKRNYFLFFIFLKIYIFSFFTPTKKHAPLMFTEIYVADRFNNHSKKMYAHNKEHCIL